MGYIRRRIASRWREVMLLSLYMALVGPPLEWCVQFWAPQHRKDVDIVEQVHQRAIEMLRGLEHMMYKERLRDVFVPS